jgi:hypothetical protein
MGAMREVRLRGNPLCQSMPRYPEILFLNMPNLKVVDEMCVSIALSWPLWPSGAHYFTDLLHIQTARGFVPRKP